MLGKISPKKLKATPCASLLALCGAGPYPGLVRRCDPSPKPSHIFLKAQQVSSFPLFQRHPNLFPAFSFYLTATLKRKS